jgi:hypothetical protein
MCSLVAFPAESLPAGALGCLRFQKGPSCPKAASLWPPDLASCGEISPSGLFWSMPCWTWGPLPASGVSQVLFSICLGWHTVVAERGPGLALGPTSPWSHSASAHFFPPPGALSSGSRALPFWSIPPVPAFCLRESSKTVYSNDFNGSGVWQMINPFPFYDLPPSTSPAVHG